MPIFLYALPEAAIKAEQELTVTLQTATQMSHEEQVIFFKDRISLHLHSNPIVIGKYASFVFFSLAPGLISSHSFGEKRGE